MKEYTEHQKRNIIHRFTRNDNHPGSLMVTVFENGVIKKEWTLDEIRNRINEHSK